MFATRYILYTLNILTVIIYYISIYKYTNKLHVVSLLGSTLF